MKDKKYKQEKALRETKIGGLLTGEILPLVTLGVNLCTVASPPFAPYCVRWLVSVRAVS